MRSGRWFNINISSYQYKKSHYGDKTIVRSSYLHNGISFTGKATPSFQIRAQLWIHKTTYDNAFYSYDILELRTAQKNTLDCFYPTLHILTNVVDTLFPLLGWCIM